MYHYSTVPYLVPAATAHSHTISLKGFTNLTLLACPTRPASCPGFFLPFSQIGLAGCNYFYQLLMLIPPELKEHPLLASKNLQGS